MTDTETTSALERTPLYGRHVAAGAKMVGFAGWEMPIQYPAGIIGEHLATRKRAGLFDVSHMGRFVVRGPDAPPFLQHVLTNNADGLEVCQAQYTVIPTPTGGAIDDAYLYRFYEDEYLLVVNAANREKDWEHFARERGPFAGLELEDATRRIAMVALQGPRSRAVLASQLTSGGLPDVMRNELSIAILGDVEVLIGRTGYTGEPICFELFMPAERAGEVWDALVGAGAAPSRVGARAPQRRGAALPLYGFELGTDPGGEEIPVYAIPLAKLAVSMSPLKGDYIGREALRRQRDAYVRIVARDWSLNSALPRMVQPIALRERGIARSGAPVSRDGKQIGWVTSGTSIPYWQVAGEGLDSRQTDERAQRAIALAYMDSDVVEDDVVEVDIRGSDVQAVVVPYHARSDAPPYTRPIIDGHEPPSSELPRGDAAAKARLLLEETVANTAWRQRECIDLIPSEMTASPLVRLASIMDPSFRYAEHREAEAFYEVDVFYYQGTEFIAAVEERLKAELVEYLGCAEVETRAISGQMANATVFSAMVEYLNRGDPKSEPRRIPMVMNNHIAKGGHLSAQPMGALRDFVARDPRTDAPAVVNFPMREDNPYRIELGETFELIERFRPKLIIFGRSMVLHPEPVREVREFLSERSIDAVVMYDMAHVLGLVGPHFQRPFEEGADLVTGSTHKTFFGTQRGVVGGRFVEGEERYDLWEAIQRRSFPGSVSNHHLGTLLGLLVATYEMNAFKDAYQRQVVTNAKAFARALHERGVSVAGDPTCDFTETHQVIVKVGYGRGYEVARRLEANNIICNYQGLPDEEAFTAAGGLRLGVSEMTRFGMKENDFADVADLMAAVILDEADVKERVREVRAGFTELHYCFGGGEFERLGEELRALV
jgi:aminomethyltransferase